MKIQVFVNSGTGFAALGHSVELNAATFKAQAPAAREAWVCAQVATALSAVLEGRKITRCKLTKVGAKVLLGKTDGSKGTTGIYITLAAAPKQEQAPVKVWAKNALAATGFPPAPRTPVVRTLKSDLVGAQRGAVTRLQHATGKSAAECIAFLGY